MSDNIKISGDNPVFNDLGVDKVSFNPNTLKPPLQDDVGAFKKILGGNDNDKKKPSSSHSADDISKANGNKNERVDDPIRHFFKDHESDSLEDFDGQNLPGSSYGLIGEVADEASGRQELGASAQEDALLSQENAFGHGTDRIGEVADEVSGRQRLGASAEEDALLSQENAFGHVTGRIGEVTDEAAVRQKLGASAKEDALLSQENAFGHGIGGIGEVADEVSGRQRLGASGQENAFGHGIGRIGEVTDEVSGRQRLGASGQENAFGHGIGRIGEVTDEVSGRQRLGASGQENAFGHGTGRIGEVADEAAVRQKLGASGQENAFGHGTDRTAGQRSMENRDTRMQTTKMDDDDKTKPLGKFDDLNMDPAKMSTGERILSSMQSISEASASSKFAAETIVKISSEIANRILISNAALDAKQEVRVQLKNDILPGTEIFIAKDGPKLNVQFNVAVSESAFFLMGRQGELRQHLIDNLKEITFVEINIKDDSQPNDTRKDGRSKNQRQYENQEEMGNFDE